MTQCLLFFKRSLMLGLLIIGVLAPFFARAGLDISQTPLAVGGSGTPLVMLVLGRDHRLYYEAYNDASDLDGDGVLDTTYKPDKIDYFGLFDSFLCYSYSSEKFSPVSKTITKKCSGSWSGDFLNYLTTSRMDALRKVLYGGYRVSANDTATGTVLERSYIPQDAHSWGKEYFSIAYDGYDISQYTDLPQPVIGTRHLFANTTLLNDAAKKPLLRVLRDSNYRIWEWVSIERPVAGDKCLHGGSGPLCETGPSRYEGHPANNAEYNSIIAQFANSSHLYGSGARSQISGSGNPFNASQDYYLTVFTGKIKVITGGTYNFVADGDDAVEFLLDGQPVAGYYGGHGNCANAGSSSATIANCLTSKAPAMFSNTVTLQANREYTLEFRHQERTGGDNYYLFWKGPDSSNQWKIVPTTAFSGLIQSTYDVNIVASTRRDFVVRVDACVAGYLNQNDPDASEYCRGYPVGKPTVFKPAGLLQQYGEDEPERMAFGLITGSYMKNTDGGVVRKDIGPFSKTDDAGNEIKRDTGVFDTSVNGIAQTLNTLTTTGFSGSYQYSCGWIVDRPIKPGECRMWGNPIGEMLYESLRYFAGKPDTSAPKPTPDFTYTGNDDGLALPNKTTWQYPFRQGTGGYSSGAKCFILTISDTNLSYDTDKVPGSAFASFTGDLSGLNAADLAQTIWNNEEQSNPAFIGHSLDNNPPYDGAPTAKTTTSLGRIRGLSPEEPTKQGGFYAASVAFFGNAQGLGGNPGKQRVETLSVALASPLPRIEIPVGTDNNGKPRYITLVPFAKSEGGSVSGTTIDPAVGKFQPTNQIVDFYVEKINYADPTNGGRPHGVFRINYEDVEQGADHDMDAIVRYEFWVLEDNTVQVRLESSYAAGSIEHHLGYVIAGTDGQDGIYLDVRDKDTSEANDDDYFLDTPLQTTTDATGMTLKRAAWPTNAWQHKTSYGALPLTATRLFRPATGAAPTAAYIKHDPLWYAAKWGGFRDRNSNHVPDSGEWDSKQSGEPDNYFLVTNPGRLKKQLSLAFSSILSTSGSASVVALNSSKAYGPQNEVYQAQFNSGDWSGNVLALKPSSPATGTLQSSITWDAGDKIDQMGPSFRDILTYKPSEDSGIPFRWPGNPESPSANELDKEQARALSDKDDTTTPPTYNYAVGRDRLEFLRGNNAQEGEVAGKFRKRGSDLGDIVNSSPVFIEKPNGGYRDTVESVPYSSFVNSHASRTAMLYVGSNDGMLHGFAGEDGSEKIAYVPSLAFKQLKLLTGQDYNTSTGAGSATATYSSRHLYYVDGQIDVGDAFFDGTWHSVLVGRLGAGGQGMFALDVTNPATFSEGNADDLALWEFTDADDPDLGYTLGGSWVTKMNNGEWVAVFGNGYNSDSTDDTQIGTGQGVLFIVKVKTGEVIQKLDAGPSSGGLSSPAIYDVNGDGTVDWIYAGDIQGNLWKFDVSSNNQSNWTVKRLFTAETTDINGNRVGQPITSAPSLMIHPKGGVMVLFGTGRYLGSTDLTNTDRQSYYGIWDQESDGSNGKPSMPFTPVTQGQLLRQFFSDTVVISGELYRTSSDTELVTERGWYIDLPDSLLGSGSERVYEDSALYKGLIVFGSKVPAKANPTVKIEACDVALPGGRSWVNVLDALTGKRAKTTFVEVDVDGKTTKIKTGDDKAPSGRAIEGITGGISVTLDGYVLVSRPLKQGEAGGKSIPIEVLKIGEEEEPPITPGGRKTWRQLR
jgi:type IV pilus assembly protein PilY1